MATGWPVSRCGEPVRWREPFPAAVLPPVTDPIPDAFLAQLWALLSNPAAIARLLRRPRLARHPPPAAGGLAIPASDPPLRLAAVRS